MFRMLFFIPIKRLIHQYDPESPCQNRDRDRKTELELWNSGTPELRNSGTPGTGTPKSGRLQKKKNSNPVRIVCIPHLTAEQTSGPLSTGRAALQLFFTAMAETAVVTDKMAVKETFRVSGATPSELRINQRVLACMRPAAGEKGVKIMRALCCTLAEYLLLKGRGLVCLLIHLWVRMTALLRARDILLALINTVYFFNLNNSVWRRRPVMWTLRNGHRTLTVMMVFGPGPRA